MEATKPDESTPSLSARRRSVLWRIHFWAALIASPFALIAALTGILYIFTPQVERALYGPLLQVAPRPERQALDAIVAAAEASAPKGYILQSLMTPHTPEDSVQITFAPRTSAGAGEGHHHEAGEKRPARRAASPDVPSKPKTIVFVDPYSAKVLGRLDEPERFSQWSSKLHSTLLQGSSWRWMIELAASWLMVMLLTGIYLWWPRGRRKALPQGTSKGRKAWSQWHGFIGVALSLISLVVLSTGITWSRYAGEQVRNLRDRVGQAPPRVPDGLSSGHSHAAPLSWQAAWDLVRRRVPDVRLQLTPPADRHGVWKANSADRSQPRKRFDLVLDRYSGDTLYYAAWDRQTAFSKAAALGIPFHRGEFGVWNQAALLLFGVGVLFSLLSGWAMFFKRRRRGAGGLPRLLPGAWRSVPLAAWVTAALLCALMPVLAVSSAVVLVFEWFAGHRIKANPGRAG